jgi:hypothetical protein
MNRQIKQSRQLYEQAQTLAESELMRVARKILKKNRDFREITVAMGAWNFVDREGNPIARNDPRIREFVEVSEYYEEMFDNSYGPWRFTATGEIITNW